MKSDKGNQILNVIFGAFLIINTISIGMGIYDRNQQKKEPENCKCNE